MNQIKNEEILDSLKEEIMMALFKAKKRQRELLVTPEN